MSSAKTINSSLGAQGQAQAPLLFPQSSFTPTADKGLPDDPQQSRRPLSASTSSRLSPLSRHKYYDSPGKQLLFDFISDFLAVFVIGFQPGHGSISDQILFNDDNKTMCVPVSVMLLGQEEARSLVKAKIIEKRRTFLLAPISFEEARLDGIAWG